MTLYHKRVLEVLWTAILLAVTTLHVPAGVNVLTYHYDNARTGQNTNETILKLSNVNTNSFGLLFTYPVDGYVYAQPLILTNLTIPGQGVHNVLFVATEHDSVYAFDADGNAGSVPLWQVSFINPGNGVTTFPSSDINCGDLVPEVGITGTPVIDPAGGTIYVVAKTKEITGGVTNYFHRLHALSITNGAEKFGGPVLVQATVAGTGDGNDGAGHVSLDPFTQFNRTGMLLNNGILYFGFASHCDVDPFHGWLFAYNAQTLALSNVFNSTPNGGDGGIWESGCAPAMDANGNIYVATGNGTFDATNGVSSDYGDSIIKLSTANGLALADYFTPFDEGYLDANDQDLGSGGIIVLPDEAGSAQHPHLLIESGKVGEIYLVDRDDMGQFNPTNNSQIVEDITAGISGNCFCTPAYFNNTIYYMNAGDALKAWGISNAYVSVPSAVQSTNTFGFPGATPSVSANGVADAIVWVIDSHAYKTNGQSVLHAYNATNVSQEIYNSNQAGARDNPGGAVKFTVPTVANGKVYIGAEYAVSVFGIFPTNSAAITNGLTGEYFSSQLETFTNPPTLVRVDPTVNFNWGTGSPDPSISSDFFTVRWTGAVQPQFNETYTFYTTTDDGVRLWVNGQLLVDKWIDQAATEWSGSISLIAGKKYPITMEYYEDEGDAVAQLSWSSPSTAMAIIPQIQLFPTYQPVFGKPANNVANDGFQIWLSGLVGKDYVFQGSSNLETWIPIITNASPPNPGVTLPTNIFYFSDPSATNFPHRFYRAMQQP
jgi:hypothetical protein